MYYRIQAAILSRAQQALTRPDRGMETLEIVAWAAGIIVVIGGLLLLFKSSLTDFWNSINFSSVLPG